MGGSEGGGGAAGAPGGACGGAVAGAVGSAVGAAVGGAVGGAVGNAVAGAASGALGGALSGGLSGGLSAVGGGLSAIGGGLSALGGGLGALLGLVDDHPAPSFYFRVIIGIFPYSFKEVSGISVELNLESVQEGGQNGFVHQLPNGLKQSKLTMKRCVIPLTSPLFIWCSSILQECLMPVVTMPIIVMLMKANGLMPARTWAFENAYPVKWEVEKLDSMENKVAIESLTFTYGRMRQL